MLERLDRRERLRLVEFVCSFAWAGPGRLPGRRPRLHRLSNGPRVAGLSLTRKPLRGARACEEFDARLAEDLAADPLAAAAAAAGLAPADLARARAGVEGLRRLEELREELPAAERAALGVEALVRLEALAALGGPAVLPARAELRLRALPPAAGWPRARLDLERTLRAGRALSMADLGLPWLLLRAADVAALAAEAGAPWARDLGDRLVAAAAAWAREAAVAAGSLQPDAARRVPTAETLLARHLADLQAGHEFPALTRRCDPAALRRALALDAQDLERLRAPYKFLDRTR